TGRNLLFNSDRVSVQESMGGPRSPRNEGTNLMGVGTGVIRGHLVTLRRFLLTFWRDIRAGQGLKRRGGGPLLVDLFRTPERGKETTVTQDYQTTGFFTVEYPDERL